MYKQGGKSFWQHHPAPYCAHHVISIKVDSQIACKNTRFGVQYQYGKWDAMVQGKISISAGVLHNLCFFVLDAGGMLNALLIASLSPLGMVQILSFLLWLSVQNTRFGVASLYGGKGVIYCNDRYQMLPM